MRLINTTTMRLEEFLDSNAPEYVILSHTWGQNEISFQQFQVGLSNDKIGGCCAKAIRDGFQYIWIDTCCIDKTSSSELSEAINSMYRWYKAASICYAYLEDIPSLANYSDSAFEACKWFKRGWTLQELIAPAVVEFYTRDWEEIGTKMSLSHMISGVTGIPTGVLMGTEFPVMYNVAERLSWASSRRTTRIEDDAYSLLGIFNVHMPLLYGEGRNAFQRLQEEILKNEEDYSIFAWPTYRDMRSGSLLARSPEAFSKTSADYRFSDLVNIQPRTLNIKQGVDNHVIDGSKIDSEIGGTRARDLLSSHFPPPPTMTSRGINITLPMSLLQKLYISTEYLAAICEIKNKETAGKPQQSSVKLVCVKLSSRIDARGIYTRVPEDASYRGTIKEFSIKELAKFAYETIDVPRNNYIDSQLSRPGHFVLSINLPSLTKHRIEVAKIYRLHIFGKIVETVMTPLSSTTYFETMFAVSGVIILAFPSKSGLRKPRAVLFGVRSEMPWCKVVDTLPCCDNLEDFASTATVRRLAFRKEIFDLTADQFSHPSADRWKGRFINFHDHWSPMVDIAIRRKPGNIQQGAERTPILVLSILVSDD